MRLCVLAFNVGVDGFKYFGELAINVIRLSCFSFLDRDLNVLGLIVIVEVWVDWGKVIYRIGVEGWGLRGKQDKY